MTLFIVLAAFIVAFIIVFKEEIMLDYFLNEHPMTSLVIIIVFALALIVAVVNVPIYYALDYGCSKKAEMLNTEYKFGYWTGCWVKDTKDGAWYEYTTIRNVEVK